MENKIRCSKCGRQTLSYDEKQYLDEELKTNGWVKQEDETFLCKKCANGETKNIEKMDMIIAIISILLLCITLCYRYIEF